MNLIINSYCNLHCPYCFAEDAKGIYENNVMSLENFDLCLQWLQANNEDMVQIIGGEPTINPLFKDYCNAVLKYNFTEIMVYTNGLFSDDICEFLVDISKKIKVSFLININDPKWLGEKRFAQLKKNMYKLYLHSLISIGINIYSPEQDYKYIIDIAEEFAINEVRLSLTIPNSSATVDDFKNHYNANKSNLIGLFKYAAEHRVQLYQDCNSIPLCFIEKDDLKEILKWYPRLLNDVTCNKPVMDIAPDLKVYKCFGFSDAKYAPSLLEFKTFTDIQQYFRDRLDKLRRTELTDECHSCGNFMLNGQSCGCWKYRKH